MRDKIARIVLIALGLCCVIYISLFWFTSQLTKGMPTPQALALLDTRLGHYSLSPQDEEGLEYAKQFILYNDRCARSVLNQVNRMAPLAILCGIALVYAGCIMGRVRKDKTAGEQGD